MIVLVLSLILNFSSSTTSSHSTSTDPSSISFSFTQSHFYSVQAYTYRLNQQYFVSERSAWDLRRDPNKKARVRSFLVGW